MRKCVLFLLGLLVSMSSFAQTGANKTDIIVKLNGEELKVSINRINSDEIAFVYPGEKLEYTLQRSEVLKIVHSSGRVEIINDVRNNADLRKDDDVSMASSPVSHHNKIAILPFTFLKDNQAGADEVGLKAQQDAYAFLVKYSAGYTILDPRTTNAMLIKKGITKDKMMGFTMQEICNTLGVEYIIDGSITQASSSQTSYTGNSSSQNLKRDRNDRVKGSYTFGSSYGSSEQRYSVAVSVQIYMDNNASIYNQSHKAFFTNTDGGYSSPLEYLLKRCPLYNK